MKEDASDSTVMLMKILGNIWLLGVVIDDPNQVFQRAEGSQSLVDMLSYTLC